jgi:hypothetical protein
MSNVISLDGSSSVDEHEVDPKLTSELERILEATTAGEITGFAGSFVHRNGAVSFSFAGRVGSFAHIGAIEVLKERLVKLGDTRT